MANVTLRTIPLCRNFCINIICIRRCHLIEGGCLLVSFQDPNWKRFGHKSRFFICTLCYIHMHVAHVEYRQLSYTLTTVLAYSVILTSVKTTGIPATMMRPSWRYLQKHGYGIRTPQYQDDCMYSLGLEMRPWDSRLDSECEDCKQGPPKVAMSVNKSNLGNHLAWIHVLGPDKIFMVVNFVQ